jgi:ankyrin repeat protein
LLGLPPLQGALRASRLHISFYPLHAAVMNEDVGQVTELLAQGQDPNQTDFFSVSDVTDASAAHRWCFPACTCLPARSCRPTCSKVGVCCPLQVASLHVAVALGNIALVKVLLDGGANPNVSSALGTMPLQLAVAHGKTEVCAPCRLPVNA